MADEEDKRDDEEIKEDIDIANTLLSRFKCKEDVY